MDNEVLELLKIMQSDMQKMQGNMQTMQGDVQTMQGDMKAIKSDMKIMDGKIDKNALMLESLGVKTKTIAEVLNNHMDENEKQHKEIIIPVKEKIDVIELAVKDISKDMKEMNGKFDKVEKVTMQNTYDVAYLKMAK